MKRFTSARMILKYTDDQKRIQWRKRSSICFWRILTQKKGCFLVSTAIRSSSNDVCMNRNTGGTLTSAHSLAFTFFLRHYCSLGDCRGFKKHAKYISTTPDSSVGHTGREKLLTRLIEMLCNDMKTSNLQSWRTRRSSSCSRVHPNASGLDRGVKWR